MARVMSKPPDRTRRTAGGEDESGGNRNGVAAPKHLRLLPFGGQLGKYALVEAVQKSNRDGGCETDTDMACATEEMEKNSEE